MAAHNTIKVLIQKISFATDHNYLTIAPPHNKYWKRLFTDILSGYKKYLTDRLPGYKKYLTDILSG